MLCTNIKIFDNNFFYKRRLFLFNNQDDLVLNDICSKVQFNLIIFSFKRFLMIKMIYFKLCEKQWSFMIL
jgi:hypothetical protein